MGEKADFDLGSIRPLKFSVLAPLSLGTAHSLLPREERQKTIKDVARSDFLQRALHVIVLPAKT